MVCKNCGNNIQDEMMFCSQCGSPVVIEEEKSFATQKKNNKKKIIAGISVFAVLAVAIIIISVLVSSYSSTKYMRNALSTNEAFIINDVYAQAYGNSELIEKYDKLIEDKLDEIINSINTYDFYETASVNGSDALLDYLTLNWGTICEDPYDDYESSISSSISSSNYVKWEELILLIDSKIDYCDGLYAYANGNYESAIRNFSYVSESDSNFADAETYISDSVTAYIDASSSNAQELINNGDISGGIELLTSAKEFIDSCGFDSDTLSTMINDTLSTYAAQYTAKAEAAFNSRDVDSAIENIKIALELQPDNADYKTKYDSYKLYLPFKLYLSENYILKEADDAFWGTLGFDYIIESNDNREMDHSIQWYNNNSNRKASIRTIYKLNGKYDYVSGTIFLPNEYKNTTLSGYIEAFGDGKLLYTSQTITGGVLPQEILFDVSDVQELTIAFHGEGTGGFLGNGADFAVSNLIAQKAFPN